MKGGTETYTLLRSQIPHGRLNLCRQPGSCRLQAQRANEGQLVRALNRIRRGCERLVRGIGRAQDGYRGLRVARQPVDGCVEAFERHHHGAQRIGDGSVGPADEASWGMAGGGEGRGGSEGGGEEDGEEIHFRLEIIIGLLVWVRL